MSDGSFGPARDFPMVQYPESAAELAREQLLVLKEIRDLLILGFRKPQPDGEHQLLGIVKGVAEELTVAAEALEQSAAQLKADSKGFRAGQAKQAAMRARQAAQDLVRG